jgi:pimeloyl-ACP methyl ester carboxylesterase
MVWGFLAAFAIPGTGERWLRRRAARLGPEKVVREVMELVDLPIEDMATPTFQAHVDLVRERSKMPWAERALIEASRSLLTYLARPKRLYNVLDHVTVPTLLIHGHNDRLIPLAAAHAMHRLRPDWTFRDLQGIGHVPMLEAPGEFVEMVQKWLDDSFEEANEKAG